MMGTEPATILLPVVSVERVRSLGGLVVRAVGDNSSDDFVI
jgi:hypothetical protein